MPHVDRNGSKEAIQKLIRDEKRKISELQKRKRRRKEEGLPVDHLDKEIEDERQSIIGKETVLEIVDGFGQTKAIDAEITAEEELLKDGKKALEELRRREPKPRREIDELARNVERLERRIRGKKEAKEALVFD